MAAILVCDDDKEIVEAISIYLEQEGHQILKAYDGQQALSILEKEKVDLLSMLFLLLFFLRNLKMRIKFLD